MAGFFYYLCGHETRLKAFSNGLATTPGATEFVAYLWHAVFYSSTEIHPTDG